MKAVLWDLDGTLVDSEPAHSAAFDAALASFGLAVPPEFHLRLLGASDDRVHEALVNETSAAISRTEWRAVKWEHYRAEAEGISRLPATRLLQPLRDGGVGLAVVSNSTRAEVDYNLAVTGLARFFAITVSRNDVGQGKPEPEGYLQAAGRLGAAPAECVVIEDSPTGAAAGIAAGMTTVFQPQDPGLPGPAGAIRAGPCGLASLFARLGLFGSAQVASEPG